MKSFLRHFKLMTVGCGYLIAVGAAVGAGLCAGVGDIPMALGLIILYAGAWYGARLLYLDLEKERRMDEFRGSK